MKMLLERVRLAAFVTLLAAGVAANHFAPLPAAEKIPADKKADVKAEKIVPLNPEETVLLDATGKRILLKGNVVLRDGALEMLCCLKQTKEHEAILSVDTKAYIVHAALLSIGAKPGKPAQFVPDYQPGTGQQIDIFLQWKDAKGKVQRVPAQNWIRHLTRRYYVEKLDALPQGFKIKEDGELRYDTKHKELLWYGPMDRKQHDQLVKSTKSKPFQKAIDSIYLRSQPRDMQTHWIFTGSGFDVDDEGKQYYLAESGDLICVANFSTATLDVAAKSAADNSELMFETKTEVIPPKGTEVLIELIPRFEKTAPKDPKSPAPPANPKIKK